MRHRTGLNLTVIPLLGALACAPALAAGTASGPTFFRYRDANGTLVMGSTIPAEIAKKNGYEIVDSMGRVIDTIPPAPSEEELEARKLQKLEEQRRKEEAARQAEEDAKLLKLYAVPDDAIQARERKLQEIDTLISLKEGSRHNLQVRLSNLEKQAADLEKSGREVPEDILEQMSSLTEQINRLSQEIRDLEREKVAIAADFDRKIERLKILMEQRRKARQQAAGQS